LVVAGKQSDRFRASSVLATWSIRDLGLTATEVGKYLGLSKSAVSRAANRSQKLIVNQSLSLKDYKRVISTPVPLFHFCKKTRKSIMRIGLSLKNILKFDAEIHSAF